MGRRVYCLHSRCAATLLSAFVVLLHHHRNAGGFQLPVAPSSLRHERNIKTSQKTVCLAETNRRKYSQSYHRKRRRKDIDRSTLSYRSRSIINSFEQACQRRHLDDNNNLIFTSRLDEMVQNLLDGKDTIDNSNRRNLPDSVTSWITARDASTLIRLLGRNGALTSMIAFLRRFCRDTVEAADERTNVTASGTGVMISRAHAEEAILYAYTAAIAACSKPASTSLSSSKDPNHMDNSRFRSKEFLLQLLEEMEHGYGSRILPSSFTLSAVLLGIDDGLEALNLLEKFIERYGKEEITVQIYNVVLASFSGEKYNKNGWHHAISLLQRMKRLGPQPNEQSFSYVLQSCAMSGQLKVALSLLEEVRQSSNMETTPKLYLPLLKVCAKAGLSDLVWSLINTMKDDSLQITTLHMNLYLNALAKAGLQKKALEVLHGMIQQSDPMQLPDLISFNTALLACAKSNDYEAAETLFGKMKEETLANIRPDVVSFNTVISCAPPQVGLDLIYEMRISRRNRKGVVVPNSVTYVNAIKQCRKHVVAETDPDIRNDIFDIALNVLSLAREDRIGLNIFVYSASIWIAEAVGDSSVALRLLQELNRDLQRSNDNQFRSTYGACYDGVISALSKDGLYREALALYHFEMQPLKLPATRNTYKSIAYALDHANDEEVKASHSKKAALLEGVLSRMPEKDRRVEVGGPLFEALIKLHGGEGSFKAAKMAFDQIIGPCDEPCLSAILRVCSSTSPTHWKEAVHLTHSSDVVGGAKGPGMIPPRALSYAVIACSQSDHWEEALNLIDLYGIDSNYRISTHRSKSSQHGLVSVTAINSVIRACSRDSRPDVAVKILNDMQTKYNVAPNETSYRVAIIACNHAEHRERRQRNTAEDTDTSNPLEFKWWECGLSLLRRMKEDQIRPSVQAYSSAVSSCEAAGQWQRAIGVLQSMREEGDIPNLYCLNAAISACEKGGAWVEALELFESIRSQRNSNNAIRPNFITVNSLLIALEKANQLELAETIYNEAMRDKIVTPWKRRYDNDGTLRRMMDLHKFSAPMAKIAVRGYVESLLTRKEKPIRGDTIFIVGKGRGSEGKPVLLPTILQLMGEDLGLDAKVDENNCGRIRVSGASIEKFIKNKRWKT